MRKIFFILFYVVVFFSAFSQQLILLNPRDSSISDTFITYVSYNLDTIFSDGLWVYNNTDSSLAVRAMVKVIRLNKEVSFGFRWDHCETDFLDEYVFDTINIPARTIEKVFHFKYFASHSVGNSLFLVSFFPEGGRDTANVYISFDVRLMTNIKDVNYTMICYPNPVKNYMYIFMQNSENRIIQIYNLQGKQVFKYNTFSQNIRLNFTDWKSGVYILQIKQKNEIFTKKIIIE